VFVVYFIGHFVTGHSNFGRIDNHDVVTGIDMRCVNWLVLAA